VPVKEQAVQRQEGPVVAHQRRDLRVSRAECGRARRGEAWAPAPRRACERGRHHLRALPRTSRAVGHADAPKKRFDMSFHPRS
jgi:hypothetical protein